jgi:hypothetical protein
VVQEVQASGSRRKSARKREHGLGERQAVASFMIASGSGPNHLLEAGEEGPLVSDLPEMLSLAPLQRGEKLRQRNQGVQAAKIVLRILALEVRRRDGGDLTPVES